MAHLMPSSAIEAANSVVHEIFTDGTIDEGCPAPYDKVTLKTVRGIYQMFTDKIYRYYMQSNYIVSYS